MMLFSLLGLGELVGPNDDGDTTDDTTEGGGEGGDTDDGSQKTLLDFVTSEQGAQIYIMLLLFLLVGGTIFLFYLNIMAMSHSRKGCCLRCVCFIPSIVVWVLAIASTFLATSSLVGMSIYSDALDGDTWTPLVASSAVMFCIGFASIYKCKGHEPKTWLRPCSCILYPSCMRFKGMKAISTIFAGGVTAGYYWLLRYSKKKNPLGTYFGAMFAAGLENTISLDSIVTLAGVLVVFFILGKKLNQEMKEYVITALMGAGGTMLYSNSMFYSATSVGFGLSTVIRSLISAAVGIVFVIKDHEFKGFTVSMLLDSFFLTFPIFILFPLSKFVMSNISAHIMIFGLTLLMHLFFDYNGFDLIKTMKDTKKVPLMLIFYLLAPAAVQLVAQLSRVFVECCGKDKKVVRCCKLCVCNPNSLPTSGASLSFINEGLYASFENRCCCITRVRFDKILFSVFWFASCAATFIALYAITSGDVSVDYADATDDTKSHKLKITYIAMLFYLIVGLCGLFLVFGILLSFSACCCGGKHNIYESGCCKKCHACMCYKGLIFLFLLLTAAALLFMCWYGLKNEYGKWAFKQLLEGTLLICASLVAIFGFMTLNALFAQVFKTKNQERSLKKVKDISPVLYLDEFWRNEKRDEPRNNNRDPEAARGKYNDYSTSESYVSGQGTSASYSTSVDMMPYSTSYNDPRSFPSSGYR